MAKTIKFNLICDEKPIRTIEDLQNNFSIEDVLAYYNNKLLHRWLSVRGYAAELEQVSAITSQEPMEIIKELIRIFDIASDTEKVDESLYMLKYLEERKELCAIYEEENYNAKQIIADYEAGYTQLVNGILDNENDVALIKANIAEIVSQYEWVFALNYRELFWGLYNQNMALAIMCLLMNEKARDYYLPVKITNEDGTTELDIESNSDKNYMYNFICKLINKTAFADMLGENLMSFAGQTDGYWKDLESKGKKYMIISMENGDYVRSAGNVGGDLSSSDILNQFVIVDGIDYKSNYSNHKLYYMEV